MKVKLNVANVINILSGLSKIAAPGTPFKMVAKPQGVEFHVSDTQSEYPIVHYAVGRCKAYSIDEEGEICIQLNTFDQICRSISAGEIIIEGKNNTAIIHASSSSVQKLVSIHPDEWKSGKMASQNPRKFSVNVHSLLELCRRTKISCHPAFAPLTSILVRVDPCEMEPVLRGDSFDRARLSFVDIKGAVISTDEQKTPIQFLITVNAANYLSAIFCKLPADEIMEVTIDADKKVSYRAGDFYYTTASEVGIENFPDCRNNQILSGLSHTYTLKKDELLQAIQLLKAVAPMANCDITMREDGGVALYAEQNNNTSKQIVQTTQMPHGVLDSKVAKVGVSVCDLFDAIRIVEAEEFEFGVFAPLKISSKTLAEIREVNEKLEWRHLIIFSSIAAREA